MNTPIIDFIKKYNKSNAVRLHMPGHKGKIKGAGFDITEIDGADSLFDASTIIDESEKNLSLIFNSNFSVYSTQGSSLSIMTMLSLIRDYAILNDKKPLILSTRNAHSSFLNGVGLLDIDVEWIYDTGDCFLSSSLTKIKLEKHLSQMEYLPTALYVTSPDYLGNILPIKEIAKVCKKHGVLLVVDNAHGSYLNFLEENIHPINLGADMCADSAHKTLPVLTGGAYLHISKDFNFFTKEQVKGKMKMFASTSPSYLTLCSLDGANKYLLEKSFAFQDCKKKVDDLKEFLLNLGHKLVGDEPLKISIDCNHFGYLGSQIANILKKENIIVEYFDNAFVVLMFSPFNKKSDYKSLKKTFRKIKSAQEIVRPTFKKLESVRKMSIREALFKKSERIKVEDAEGRILSLTNISCPPAVPIMFSGEVIDKNAIKVMKYNNIDYCKVVVE